MLSRPCQHPPSPLSDLFPKPASGSESGAVRLAHRPVRNLEGAGRRGHPPQHPDGLRRAFEARLHHRVRPSLRLPCRGRRPDGRSIRRSGGAGRPVPRLPGQHGPLQKGRRAAAGQRGPDSGRDHEGLRPVHRGVSRPRVRLHASGGAGALLALFRLVGAAASKRGSGPAIRRPAPHSSGRDAG
ncbi:hypothetical protein SDC9_174197 [bioreactor metagenome]|uniref:Uncharacterized protein n=1 Tax=bioreactor metagenome TaxID=1076179 RepID=A0A645GLM9_9ZZZZ